MAGTREDIRTLLALDVGEARIGVALANTMARIAHPIGAVPHTERALDDIAAICEREDVGLVILGLPRNMQGQDTAQTNAVRQFAETLCEHLKLPYAWQDEAVTSVQAEAELKRRKKPYTKSDIDALAATYILEDYLHAAV